MSAFDGISNQGDRFHPMHGMDVRDCTTWPVRAGGSTGKVGSFGATRENGLKMHYGIDWLAPVGRPVYAAHEGVVFMAGEQVNPGPPGAGFGVRVYLDNEDHSLRTVYGHLSGIVVTTGQRVKPGYLLGFVGRSGNIDRMTPTHLHFEVRVKGTAVDPEEWLDGKHGVPPAAQV